MIIISYGSTQTISSRTQTRTIGIVLENNNTMKFHNVTDFEIETNATCLISTRNRDKRNLFNYQIRKLNKFRPSFLWAFINGRSVVECFRGQ